MTDKAIKEALNIAIWQRISTHPDNLLLPIPRQISMTNALRDFVWEAIDKYYKGQKQYGGDITDKDLRKEAMQEITDCSSFWWRELEGCRCGHGTVVNYYNEHDPKAAAWLRELIKEGHIPAGEVDERSIVDVRADDLSGFVQCHFFAGVGGWPLALRLAGWPDNLPVDTGSCPCQPFSNAGKGLGTADPRHLWPFWFPIIQKRRPPVIFGEQVASKTALEWIDGVFTDMEGENYACGAADLCAASVGAPHIRQRLWWVANTERHVWKGKPCGGSFGRMGRIIESIPWDEPWQSALCRLRVVDDGLSYGVAGCNGPRNAIVPQVAAEFIRAYLEVTQ